MDALIKLDKLVFCNAGIYRYINQLVKSLNVRLGGASKVKI